MSLCRQDTALGRDCDRCYQEEMGELQVYFGGGSYERGQRRVLRVSRSWEAELQETGIRTRTQKKANQMVGLKMRAEH